MSRARAVALAVVLAASGAAHVAHRRADEARFGGTREADFGAEPEGAPLRIASLGFHGPLSDLMWVRGVLRFVDVYDDPARRGRPWLRATLLAADTLDPGWRTLYTYGATLLRSVGDVEGSDHLLARGRAAFPQDSFFPFSLGMNAYLFRNDVGATVRWIELAASLPNAPPWYAAAAAGFLDQRGQREAALRFLDEQLASSTRPEERAALEGRRARLLHDHYVDAIAQRRAAVEARLGRPITAVAELGALPGDPTGGAWVIGADGVVRGSSEEARLAGRAAAQVLGPVLQRGGP
jgi:hypothetical protein